MRKSKLELYEDVLNALVNKPLTVDAIAYSCNMECVTLRQRLSFLVKNNLVEEKIYNRKTCYALTGRGLAIFKTLTITRKLERLQTSIRIIEEALHALPAPSEHRKEKAKSK
jgi:predicted transcriptional regulator